MEPIREQLSMVFDLLQFVGGLFSFFLPIFSEEMRRFILPLHRFGGVAIYAVVALTSVSGIEDMMQDDDVK